MRNVLGVLLTATFVILALLHVYWSLGGQLGHSAAVPSVNGRRLFNPSPQATFMVAVALLACACAISGAIGWLGEAVPVSVFRVVTMAVAVVFLLRAIGDFRYVGFFQRGSDSPFAYWDLRLYSPLCLLIGVATLVVARSKP
jgi:uncharacterized protein DUF3995